VHEMSKLSQTKAEKYIIVNSLSQGNGNKVRAAKLLKISRATLFIYERSTLGSSEPRSWDDPDEMGLFKSGGGSSKA